MPKVAVVTAAGKGSSRWINRAAMSLADQGVDLEWCIGIDTDGQEAIDTTLAAVGGPVEPTITWTYPTARGAAAARVQAALKATSEYVYVLDADDELPSGTLLQLADVLDDYRTCKWATAEKHVEIDRNGHIIREKRSDIGYGFVAQDELRTYYRVHGRSPFTPAQIMVRTPDLWAAGAWPALPIDEDVALLLALGTGVIAPIMGLRKRVHGDQTTAQLSVLSPYFATSHEFLRLRGLI